MRIVWQTIHVISCLIFPKIREDVAKLVVCCSRDCSFKGLIDLVDHFPISHNSCRLLAQLMMYLGSLYCKQYEPESDCSPS